MRAQGLARHERPQNVRGPFADAVHLGVADELLDRESRLAPDLPRLRRLVAHPAEDDLGVLQETDRLLRAEDLGDGGLNPDVVVLLVRHAPHERRQRLHREEVGRHAADAHHLRLPLAQGLAEGDAGVGPVQRRLPRLLRHAETDGRDADRAADVEDGERVLESLADLAENVIGEIGKGLKYALTILNVGRAISIPAICLGMAKQAWQPTLDRANSRITFGKPLGERQTQMMRIGRMATDLFAMEALASLVWRMADQKHYDIRIEAAIAKIFCSEKAIRFLKDAQIIFGGMGYETAESRQVRGEPGFPIEQLVRDAEMYRIGEGATDILRPFVAREALSPHLERARTYLEERLTGASKLREWLKLLRGYVPRYLGLWKRTPLPDREEFRRREVSEKLLCAERVSRRLARTILYAMARYREALRDDQGRQNRIEEIGEDILTIAATALHAEALRRAQGDGHVWDLADEFFREAVTRIDANIAGLLRNDDHQPAAVGQRALRSQYPSLSGGIIQRSLDDYILKK